MKLKQFFSPLMIVAVAMCGIFASCSDKAETIEDKLKTYVSDDTNLIVTLDLKRALDAVEIEANEKEGTLELPGYLNDFIKDAFSKDDKKALDDMLEFKGFDWTNTVFGIKFDTKDGIEPKSALIIFSVKDDDEFAEALEDIDGAKLSKDEDKTEGFTVVSNKHFAVMIDGHLGFIAIDKKGPCKATKAATVINEWKDAADEKALADWKVEKLKTEKIANVFLSLDIYKTLFEQMGNQEKQAMKAFGVESLYDAYAMFSFDLNAETVSFDCQLFGKDGKDFENKNFAGSKIDTSLLAYANSQDLIAGAMGIGDVSKVVKGLTEAGAINKSEADQASAVLKLLNNSTLFVAAGPVEGINSFTRPSLGNWHFVAALKTQSAANSQELVNMAASLLGGELNKDESGNMSISVPTDYTYDYDPYTYDYVRKPIAFKTLFIKQDGNTIVVSNSAISKKGGCPVSEKIFDGKYMALGLVAPKTNPLLSSINMPFGFNAQLSGTTSAASFSASLTGVSGKFIPTLFKFFYENMGNISSMGSTSAYDNDYAYADSVAVEEVAAVEEYDY